MKALRICLMVVFVVYGLLAPRGASGQTVYYGGGLVTYEDGTFTVYGYTAVDYEMEMESYFPNVAVTVFTPNAGFYSDYEQDFYGDGEADAYVDLDPALDGYGDYDLDFDHNVDIENFDSYGQLQDPAGVSLIEEFIGTSGPFSDFISAAGPATPVDTTAHIARFEFTWEVPPPDFTLSEEQSINDGENASFSITVTSGAASSYQWSFSNDPAAGNEPLVNFTAPTSQQTNTDGHWFALPDLPCDASVTATYTITAQVRFTDGTSLSKDQALLVKVPWNVAGRVDTTVATVAGSPDDARQSDGLWHVTGPGTLARVVPLYPQNVTIYIPNTSQFYNKTLQHELKHIDNWVQGPGHLFGDLFISGDFFNLIKDLTGTTELDLVLKIRDAKSTYLASQKQLFDQRHQEDEREAYAVSDPIAPQYLYQTECQNQF